jgi:hypothetical protein
VKKKSLAFCILLRRQLELLEAFVFKYHPNQVLARGSTILEGATESGRLLSSTCFHGGKHRVPNTLEIYLDLAP